MSPGFDAAEKERMFTVFHLLQWRVYPSAHWARVRGPLGFLKLGGPELKFESPTKRY